MQLGDVGSPTRVKRHVHMQKPAQAHSPLVGSACQAQAPAVAHDIGGTSRMPPAGSKSAAKSPSTLARSARPRSRPSLPTAQAPTQYIRQHLQAQVRDRRRTQRRQRQARNFLAGRSGAGRPQQVRPRIYGSQAECIHRGRDSPAQAKTSRCAQATRTALGEFHQRRVRLPDPEEVS